MVARGCGSREPGGAYLVCGLGPEGEPIERFIIDPPRIVDPEALGIAPQGITLYTGAPEGRDAHLVDWVGEKHYPNVADFVEEVAHFGSSRRIPSTFDFSQLGLRSKHVLVHARAAVTPASAIVFAGLPEVPAVSRPSTLQRALARQGRANCPFLAAHEMGEPMQTCAAWWWEWLQPKTVVFASDLEAMERQCTRLDYAPRNLPALTYAGYALPDRDVWKPDWRPAAFMALPVHRIEVVRDPLEGAHELVVKRARKSALQVLEVDLDDD